MICKVCANLIRNCLCENDFTYEELKEYSEYCGVDVIIEDGGRRITMVKRLFHEES